MRLSPSVGALEVLQCRGYATRSCRCRLDCIALGNGRVDWTLRHEQRITTISQTGLSQVAWLVGLALLLGVIVNPFQFPFTQWLEGYWGGDNVSLHLATHRINRYREFIRDWYNRGYQAEQQMIVAAALDPAELAGLSHEDRLTRARVELAGQSGDSLVTLDQMSRHALRVLQGYPQQARVMPTGLGNALRAFEDKVGRQYGLNAVLVAPHLNLLGENPRSRYVRDTRQSMDLAIRLTMMALLVTPLTGLLLANDGGWVLSRYSRMWSRI